MRQEFDLLHGLFKVFIVVMIIKGPVPILNGRIFASYMALF